MYRNVGNLDQILSLKTRFLSFFWWVTNSPFVAGLTHLDTFKSFKHISLMGRKGSVLCHGKMCFTKDKQDLPACKFTSGALWVDHIPWQKHIGFQNYCLPQASLSNKQVDLCKQQELQWSLSSKIPHLKKQWFLGIFSPVQNVKPTGPRDAKWDWIEINHRVGSLNDLRWSKWEITQ